MDIGDNGVLTAHAQLLADRVEGHGIDRVIIQRPLTAATLVSEVERLLFHVPFLTALVSKGTCCLPSLSVCRSIYQFNQFNILTY